MTIPDVGGMLDTGGMLETGGCEEACETWWPIDIDEDVIGRLLGFAEYLGNLARISSCE